MSAAPLTGTIRTSIPALGAAVIGDQAIGTAPYAGTVTAATFTPEAAVTGNTTNTRTLRLVNRGQAGAGTTLVASLAYITGTNGVLFDEQAFTLTATVADRVVAEGDVLVIDETVAGTGLANPGGLVTVTFSRS